MTKKKHLGTKTKIRTEKERERRIATAIFLAFILLIVAFSAYFTYTFLSPSPNQTVNPVNSQLRVAIVDHLSLTFPNQTFIQTATNTLKQAGYTVDYYPGEKVTVDFYRNLPTHGYSLIILRVHSALREGSSFLALFTSEPYIKTKYVYEQLTDRVGMVQYHTGGDVYFGISHEFILATMNGRFQGTTIIMMGCNGLQYTPIAKAFIEKGAKVYIGWTNSVLASHTDMATTQLIKHLITEKQTIEQAVDNTMKEVGSYLTGKNILIYCPLEVGDQTI